jgi:hypothetical protein
MALNPGARLGPYEISGLLEAGGMGELYRARDTRPRFQDSDLTDAAIVPAG